MIIENDVTRGCAGDSILAGGPLQGRRGGGAQVLDVLMSNDDRAGNDVFCLARGMELAALELRNEFVLMV